jgi:ATP-dependent RNA helicase DeaD
MQRFLPLAHSLGESDDENGLLAMLLDDFYQETFHAPIIPAEADENPIIPHKPAYSERSRSQSARRPRDKKRRY